LDLEWGAERYRIETEGRTETLYASNAKIQEFMHRDIDLVVLGVRLTH
jgi:hypothetical protein